MNEGIRRDLQCCETEGGSSPNSMHFFIEYGVSKLVHQTAADDYRIAVE